MKLGVEVFLHRPPDCVRGRRIGLITNPTGVDSSLADIVGAFRAHTGFTISALYGPEHGIRGHAQAGETVPFQLDPHHGITVNSLYGQSHPAPADLFKDIDAHMRDYDTQAVGKWIEPAMLDGIEALVFDLHDVGTRVYTYVATMAYAMHAAADRGIPFVVLDRPNPITGDIMEGPILEFPAYSPYIGLYPVPLRHGMTAGELARMFNLEFLARPVELVVVPLEGWRRAYLQDETPWPWVLPSPNLPTLAATTVYPGQVLLEGTNLSEGRGTTKPFEFFGAPWIDGYVLAQALRAQSLPGATFREVGFTPTFSKFTRELCGGCQLHVTDRSRFRPVAGVPTLLQTVRALYPGRLTLYPHYFDRVMGTSSVREAFERGEPAAKIAAGFEAGLAQFARRREPYLLYA